MALTKNDKNFIKESIQENTKALMVWISQNFLTKNEAVSKKDLENELRPMKEDISMLKDSVAEIKSFLRSDYTILENQVIQNTKDISRVKIKLQMD